MKVKLTVGKVELTRIEMTRATPAFLGAYTKGRKAFREFGDSATCPYVDKRSGEHGHVITFSRAFQKYWRQGFEDQKNDYPVRYYAGD